MKASLFSAMIAVEFQCPTGTRPTPYLHSASAARTLQICSIEGRLAPQSASCQTPKCGFDSTRSGCPLEVFESVALRRRIHSRVPLDSDGARFSVLPIPTCPRRATSVEVLGPFSYVSSLANAPPLTIARRLKVPVGVKQMMPKVLSFLHYASLFDLKWDFTTGTVPVLYRTVSADTLTQPFASSTSNNSASSLLIASHLRCLRT
jgi:hypothetical protein